MSFRAHASTSGRPWTAASALWIVAEDGTPGEAHNVGARQAQTVDQRLERSAAALDTGFELVHASEHELGRYGLVSTDHPLVRPFPVIVSTAKLAALGLASTPIEVAMQRTVQVSIARGRNRAVHGPGRDVEERLIEAVTG